MIQFVPPRRSGAMQEFRHDLGLAVSLLRGDGFNPALLPLSGYRQEALRQAITEHRPTHVLVDIPPTRLTAARHTIVDVAERHFLPVTVVGRYATCQPEQAISIPGVTALVLGEYERPLLHLYQSIRQGAAEVVGRPEEPRWAGQTDMPGIWLNSEDGLVRNRPAPLVEDLDDLPEPDREFFDYQRTVDETGEAVFAATRGCDQWCSFCLNDWYMELYAGRGSLLRRRSVAKLLAEVAAVVDRYQGIKRVAFCDHAFVADAEWLAQFAEEYPRRCPLPYRCHVRLNSADARVADLLARSRCEIVDVEIGSGSNFIREEVLSMRTSEARIVAGVAALKRAGLSVHGRVFIGAPYDSEIALAETLDLVAALSLDAVEPRVFFPIPGTRAAEMCAENGWISGRGEENLLANRSVLDMPSFSARKIDGIARRFDVLLKRRSGRSLRSWLGGLRKLGTQPLHLFHSRRKSPSDRPRERQ